MQNKKIMLTKLPQKLLTNFFLSLFCVYSHFDIIRGHICPLISHTSRHTHYNVQSSLPKKIKRTCIRRHILDIILSLSMSSQLSTWWWLWLDGNEILSSKNYFPTTLSVNLALTKNDKEKFICARDRLKRMP